MSKCIEHKDKELLGLFLTYPEGKQCLLKISCILKILFSNQHQMFFDIILQYDETKQNIISNYDEIFRLAHKWNKAEKFAPIANFKSKIDNSSILNLNEVPSYIKQSELYKQLIAKNINYLNLNKISICNFNEMNFENFKEMLKTLYFWKINLTDCPPEFFMFINGSISNKTIGDYLKKI